MSAISDPAGRSRTSASPTPPALSDVIMKAVLESLDPATMRRIMAKIQGEFHMAPKQKTEGEQQC